MMLKDVNLVASTSEHTSTSAHTHVNRHTHTRMFTYTRRKKQMKMKSNFEFILRGVKSSLFSVIKFKTPVLSLMK